MRQNDVAVVHSFSEQLEYSSRLSDETAWVEFYQRLWPDLAFCALVPADGADQRSGVDRIVRLKNGKQFLIDEKKRKKDYGDILLEEWSVFHSEGDRRNRVGWALDQHKRCDFIAYSIPDSNKCYFLPFEFLRQAYISNRSDWGRKYRVPPAKNEGYVTVNVAVPWNVLKTELVRQMLRSFSSALELPTAMRNGAQVVFDWGG